MRTIQKRIKFSKGEINPLLSERTDIDLLDSSASYIKNYTPTIFGGVKTRLGTKKIDVIRNIINKIEEPTVTNLVNDDIIGTTQNLFTIKAANNINSFIKFFIHDIYFDAHKDTVLNMELESYEESNTNSVLDFELESYEEEETTYYRLKTITIETAGGKYFSTPIITFSKEDLGEDEVLPTATATISNYILSDITITNVGKLNSNTGLTLTITQPDTTTTYYRLKTLSIIQAGNHYTTAPTITFTKDNLEDYEILPQATATIDATGLLTNITIDNVGKLKDNNLNVSVTQPEPFNETINVLDVDNNILDTFNIDEEDNDINITFNNYQEEVTIVRASNNYIDTKLNVSDFNFNIDKPEITSNIGGNTTNNLNNFSSDVIADKTGELLHWTFEDKVNYFTINNVIFSEAKEGTLRCKVNRDFRGMSRYDYWLYQIVIDDAGIGYKNGTYDVTLTEMKSWDIKPTATAFIDEGKIKSITITNAGYYEFGEATDTYDNVLITAKLPLIENLNKAVIKFQAKNDNEEWEDLGTYNINQEYNIIIAPNIAGDGYKEFRLYKEDNEYITVNLLINNITYGNVGSFSKNTKLIPFNYDGGFLFILCEGYIIVYKNDAIITSIQAVDITEDILKEIKYTQLENKIILTHNTITPLEITYENNEWYLNKINLINIPYHNFNKEQETVVNGVTLTPSMAEGTCYLTSNTSYFTKDFVGQIIDGNGGRFRITDFKDATKVYGYTIIPFYTTDAFTGFKYINGYEPVWSDTRGWPNCCLYYQQRLWFGGSKSKPLGLWGSRTGQYNDFNNIGNYDNDAIDVELSSKDNGAIVNLYGNRGLQIFTESGEFIASEGSLTPSNIFVLQTSSVGSNKKGSVFDIAGTTLFIDKKGLNINTFVYNDSIASYNTQALTLLNNNLLKNPQTLSIDYNSSFEDGNYIFIINEDGNMIVANIVLDQNINAFTRWITTDGLIKDVTVINNDIYITVLRNNNLYLEKIGNYKTDFTQENKQIVNGILLEVEDYNKVRIYTDEIDYGVYEVIEGQVNLNDPTLNLSNVKVGIDIDCKLISNDIAVNNQTTNIKTRLTKATITADNNTKELKFNNKTYKSKSCYEDNIFDMYALSNYNLKNRFIIESVFSSVNIKSIVLSVNYGGW